MRIATIVVSFNRLELLKVCLEAIRQQSHQSDEIIVFDNGSTDGAIEYLRELGDAITLIESPGNVGGAGGFSRAISFAISRGHDLAWVMDDDSKPTQGALEMLVTCFKGPGEGRAGFVSPQVLQNDFTPLRSHNAERIPRSANHDLPGLVADECAEHATPYATFVGALINLEVAATTFLPVEEFFIWWDDTEYTARLQRIAGGVHCANAVMLHPYKQGLRDLGGRLFYDLRNRLWVLLDRRLGSTSARNRAQASFWRRLRRQARNAKSKRSYVVNVTRGVVSGVLTRPALQWPNVSRGKRDETTL